MTTRRTRAVLVSATAAGLLALAACGSSGGSTASTGATTPGSGASVSPATVTAAFDRVAAATSGKKSVKGTLTTTTSAGSVEGKFAYKFTDAGLLASFTFDTAGKSFSGILTPQAFFIGGEELGLPGGKKYLKVSLDGKNQLSQQYLELTKSFTEAGDLESAVKQWKSLGNLTEAGTETIDGVATTKYTGTVNPSAPPAGVPAEVAKAYAAAAKLGITSITTTIWIGPDGLPVQVETKSEGGKGAGTTVVKYSDWGAAVDVAAPPAAEVADLSNLLGG